MRLKLLQHTECKGGLWMVHRSWKKSRRSKLECLVQIVLTIAEFDVNFMTTGRIDDRERTAMGAAW